MICPAIDLRLEFACPSLHTLHFQPPHLRFAMSAAATRAVLRPTRLAFRGIQARNASTAQKAANAVSETASNIKSKAAEGLTKVQSSAGESVSNATSAVSNAASNVQGRTGRMIHAVQCMRRQPYLTSPFEQALTELVTQLLSRPPSTTPRLRSSLARSLLKDRR